MTAADRPDRPGTPAADDPYTEGGAATTDEWFGQSVERDIELAERLVEQHGGDLEEAERDFDRRATGAAEQEARRHGPPPTDAAAPSTEREPAEGGELPDAGPGADRA